MGGHAGARDAIRTVQVEGGGGREKCSDDAGCAAPSVGEAAALHRAVTASRRCPRRHHLSQLLRSRCAWEGGDSGHDAALRTGNGCLRARVLDTSLPVGRRARARVATPSCVFSLLHPWCCARPRSHPSIPLQKAAAAPPPPRFPPPRGASERRLGECGACEQMVSKLAGEGVTRPSTPAPPPASLHRPCPWREIRRRPPDRRSGWHDRPPKVGGCR